MIRIIFDILVDLFLIVADVIWLVIDIIIEFACVLVDVFLGGDRNL